jgi:hypothetical protein
VLLADAFWFVAHDDTTGKPRLHSGASGLGLAAALLGELLLDGRVDAFGDQLWVVDPEPPDDPLGRVVLQHLVAEPEHRAIRTWLAFLRQNGPRSITQRLELSGKVVARESRRRLRKCVQYEPADLRYSAWPETRLRSLLEHGGEWTLPDRMLAGLVSATGLSTRMLWDADVGVRRALDHVVDGLLPAPKAIIAHTEAAVGDAVLSQSP